MEWKTGQKVESLVNNQGLLKGRQYVVTGVSRATYLLSTYTVLTVQANGEKTLQVRNPSLVLKEVA